MVRQSQMPRTKAPTVVDSDDGDGDGGDGVFEVEEIRATRRRHGVTQYLIKWQGYPESENTWEPGR